MKSSSKIYQSFISYLVNLPRSYKQLLTIAVDYFVLVFTFELSLSVRINDIYQPTDQTMYFIFIAPLIALPIFYFSGLYRTLIRYSGYKILVNIIIGVSIYTVLWFLIVIASGIVIKPYDFLFINWISSISAICALRFVARWLLIQKYGSYTSALVYGAGAAGIQLESAMRYSTEVSIEGFLDDDKDKHGRSIKGLRVYNPNNLKKILKRKKINEIYIAIPSISKSGRQEILKSLRKYPILIRELPGFTDLVQGRLNISDLKLIKIEDLLKREARKANDELLKKNINNKNVLVTGGGGSIGSQLCKEIVSNDPKSIVILDINEYSLYKIEREILELNPETKCIPILANVEHERSIKEVFNKHKINTIYNTAAYKHVPMVEKNISAAIKTNIFGTLACIKAAKNSSVENFVFISTDKAVRPTNIMGATKRFAELILQSYSSKEIKDNMPEISIVRFGNVLGSSGSVVPLFRDQIKKGGPITVTDKNIIRYFMTIKEAAQLVIQAGALNYPGSIFLLDMGEPIGIDNLARDMIRLSGMSVKDSDNPNGDIEIIYTGLRPGEKLYEELLIDGKSEKTEHDKIFQAKDDSIDLTKIEKYIAELKDAIDSNSYLSIIEILKDTVTGFNHSDNKADAIIN